MNKEAAFRFIPELIGDLTHVIELSGNPTLMYLESAMSTMHAAANVFGAVEEHISTKRKEVAKQELRERYGQLADAMGRNHLDEELCRLDAEFEAVKAKVQDGQLRDKMVRDFIALLRADLSKAYECFGTVELDSSYAERSRIDELARKALRDYKGLLTIYIEEDSEGDKEQNDGQPES